MRRQEVLVGKDGLIHAANIKSSQGRTNRPIAKLTLLEVSIQPVQKEMHITVLPKILRQ